MKKPTDETTMIQSENDPPTQSFDEKLTLLKEENQELRQTVETLCVKINNLEKEARKNILILHGVNETEKNSKELIKLIIKVIKSTKIGIEDIEIKSAYRIGKKHMKKKRPILFDLTTLWKKTDILRSRKSLPNKIYIEEDNPQVVLSNYKGLQTRLQEERNNGIKESEEEDEEEEIEEDSEKDEEWDKKKSKPKKPAKKPKYREYDEDEEEDEEEESEEEEEDEEEEEEAPERKPKRAPTEPPVPLPAGKGIPLGRIINVEISLSRFTAQDQKPLHQYLYGQLCLDHNVKRNIKKFKGYEWAIGSKEYKAKLEETTKMETTQLQTFCEMLDLEEEGSPKELATRLVGFLQQPSSESPYARGSARLSRGYSDDEIYESDPETKVKGPKPNKDGSEDSDSSFDPGESEDRKIRREDRKIRRRFSKLDQHNTKGNRKRGRPRGRKRGGSESEDESEKSESESEHESASEGEESDEPKSKRGRPVAVTTPAKGRKASAASSTPAKDAKRKVLALPRYSDDEIYESDPETKVKGPKPNKDGSEDSDITFTSGESKEKKARRSSKLDQRKTKGKPKRGRPRGRKRDGSESDKSESEKSESDKSEKSESKEESEPAKNAKAVVAKRKAPAPAAKKTRGRPAGRPAAAAKKGKKASSEEESGEGSEEENQEEGSEEEGSEKDEDESGKEPNGPADKQAKRQPTNVEIKKYVKQILEGANLKKISVNTVCKQVFSHYPGFDLEHKTDLIKATVKS